MAKRNDFYLLLGVLIILGLFIWQNYCFIKLRDELEEKKLQVLLLENSLAKINSEYDYLWEEYLENFNLIRMSPLLKLEWELKHAEDQVRGVDGKFPFER